MKINISSILIPLSTRPTSQNIPRLRERIALDVVQIPVRTGDKMKSNCFIAAADFKGHLGVRRASISGKEPVDPKSVDAGGHALAACCRDSAGTSHLMAARKTIDTEIDRRNGSCARHVRFAK